ncbi:hypothetical protein KA025_02345 [Candidatus Saccharibacteria bacterium]|nr:hypothetical protein [Candidatus Saccharibacteria bacterium]MBP7834904.1 hypothetical protein [Candidatus Saccharibacteria bacterium]
MGFGDSLKRFSAFILVAYVAALSMSLLKDWGLKFPTGLDGWIFYGACLITSVCLALLIMSDANTFQGFLVAVVGVATPCLAVLYIGNIAIVTSFWILAAFTFLLAAGVGYVAKKA